MTRRLGAKVHPFDVAGAVDILRQIIARTDALVSATEHQLERFTWRSDDEDEGDEGDEDDDDARRMEHLAHLLGAAKEAARAAVMAGDQIATELVNRRTV
jgi:hypothetical protein